MLPPRSKRQSSLLLQSAHGLLTCVDIRSGKEVFAAARVRESNRLTHPPWQLVAISTSPIEKEPSLSFAIPIRLPWSRPTRWERGSMPLQRCGQRALHSRGKSSLLYRCPVSHFMPRIPRNLPRSSETRLGVSLVELLVVLGILAVLIG